VVKFWPIFISAALYNDYTLEQVVDMPNRDIATCIKIDYMEIEIQQLICGVIAAQVNSPILAKQVGIKP